MTINEAIDTLDSLQPNTCTREEKLAWLWQLDGILHAKIWSHYGLPGPETPYTREDPDKLLPAPPPWDQLYLRYLQAQVDLANGELTRYANAAALYNQLLSAYRNEFNRTHTPEAGRLQYF